jgi:hypothetical protein
MPHYKETEYFLGIIPAVILIISLFISNIKNIRRKLFLIVSLTLICFLQYICFFYDTSNTFTKSFMGGKYFYNISEKLTLKDMNKLNIGIDLVAYIYDNSITKEVYSEIKHLDMYTLQAISNSCFDNALDFVDIRFIDNFNFDIIVIDDNSVIEKDTLKAAEQAYQDYIASVVSSEEFKQYWIKKRIEETEKIKSYFYNNNFVMIKKFLFRDSFIRVYKLEK